MPGPRKSVAVRGIAVLMALLALVAAAGCQAGGTPSVAPPPVTVLQTETTVATVRTTSTSTVTVTQSPPATLVVATFQDPATFECSDTTAEWCWAVDLTTTGPCPNGAYVSLDVFRNDETAALTVLEAKTEPVVDALGSKVTVQLSTSGLTAAGDTLRATVKEARCA